MKTSKEDEMDKGDFRVKLYLDLLKRTLMNLIYMEYEPAKVRIQRARPLEA